MIILLFCASEFFFLDYTFTHIGCKNVFTIALSSVLSVGAQLQRKLPHSLGPCRGKGRGPSWRCSPWCRNPPASSSRYLKCAPGEEGERKRGDKGQSKSCYSTYRGLIHPSVRLQSTDGTVVDSDGWLALVRHCTNMGLKDPQLPT